MSEPDELPELEGIDASDEFRRYVAELRQTWVPTDERAFSLAETEINTSTEMSTEPSTDCTDCASFTRRGFMRAGATVAVTAATVGAGATPVAAQTDELNWSSEYVHEPWIDGTATIAEHDRDDEGMSSALEWINDKGEVVSLADQGARVAPQDDDAEDDEPWNPVTLRADRISIEDYHAFPRGETDEDGDGDEFAVTVLDEQHWSTDEGDTAGSISVENADAASGGDALRINVDGQGDGDTATATFEDDGDDWELSITSGIKRKHFQIVVNVDELEEETVVTFSIGDGTDDVELFIDSDADETGDDVITTETGSGIVHQIQLGELDGVDDLGEISQVEVSVADGNADITIPGFNLEKESRWNYGTEEVLNEDDELEEETVYNPSGEFSILDLDTLGDDFSEAVIADLDVEVRFEAGQLPTDHVGYEFTNADRYDQDQRLRKIVNFDIPTGYDLTWSDLSAHDEVAYPSHRYLEIGYQSDAGSDPQTLEDEEDDDLDLTAKTSTYEDASIEDEVTLTTSTVSGGEIFTLFYDVLMNDDEVEDAEDTGGAVAAAGASDDGGIMAWFSGLQGVAAAAVVGVLGYFAVLRRRVTG